MNDKAIWHAIKIQKQDLANFSETLTDSEWNTASLCNGWQVRDVVGHLVSLPRYSVIKSLPQFAQQGFSINKFLFFTAKQTGKMPPVQLVRLLREDVNNYSIPFLGKPAGTLADLIIHEQDIRLALNKPKIFDARPLTYIFEAFNSGGFGVGERLVGLRKNIKGLQLIANDINWKTGESDLRVEGSAQDLLMAIAGRPATLKRLKGNGVEVFARRITK